MNTFELDQSLIDTYQKEGAVVIRGLLTDWVDEIRAGIEKNMLEPGQYAAENVVSGDSGRFFDDYCNWTRIPEFEKVIRESAAAYAAGQLMSSDAVQIFHDHVLVKEPGTSKPTPWHQDSPYYFVNGRQNVSFWCPVDPVKEASLRCVAGSHLWEKPVLPVKWLAEDNFYPDDNQFQPVPDPDADADADAQSMIVREWELEPGDVVAFHYQTLHGARGNNTDTRRRAFSLRFMGDDARYISRQGKTSPPFPNHNMVDGDRLREDWFPVVWSRTEKHPA